MTIGVSPAIVVERSASADRPGTVTEAGGTAGPLPTGAVRCRSSRFRPTTPAATAPRPTPPARMRNDRRDQSGIWATAPVLLPPAGTAARDRSISQPRTHRPAPTEI